MKRMTVAAALVLAMPFFLAGQRAPGRGLRGGPPPRGSVLDNLPQANSDSEKKVLAVLDEAQKNGAMFQNAPPADGRMLRLLTEAAGAQRVVEIGTSTGLSGLWFCLALQKTGGRLTTFEYDAERAATAREHFRKAGVDALVTVVEGDAHQTISRLKEPIDVLFIDADKEGYTDYLKRLLPLVRPGGLILAHNIGMAPNYQKLVAENPGLETLYYRDGEGLGITLKKR